MAWEIENEYVDLAEMHHRTVYIERSLSRHDGSPVRHVDDILLGTHGFSSTRGRNSSNLSLAADGTLTDPEGKKVDIGARQKAMLADLEGITAGGRAFARLNRKKIRAAKPAAKVIQPR